MEPACIRPQFKKLEVPLKNCSTLKMFYCKQSKLCISLHSLQPNSRELHVAHVKVWYRSHKGDYVETIEFYG